MPRGTRILAGLAAGLIAFMVAVAADAGTTVTMWSFLDPAKKSPREIALKQLIENFEKANPDIKIRVEPQIFSELGVKFLLGHNGGNAPDTVFVNTENVGRVMRSGAAADLQALFIKDWPKEDDADFYVRAGWDAGLADGKRYAVPLFQGSTVLYYRKDLLKAAGIDPAAIKTWDQFTEAAKKLTRDVNGDGVIDVWGFGTPLSAERTGGTTSILSMLIGAQGEAWDAQCRPRYATDGGAKVIRLHADWITKHKIMPREALVNNIDATLDLFSAGKYAMSIGPIFQYTKIKNDATWDKAQLGVMPWPHWTPEKPGPQWVSGWWISAWSKSPRLKEAAKWVEYNVSKEAVRIWSVVGGQIPTRLSVFNEAEFQKPEYAYMHAMIEAWRKWSFLLPVHCNTAAFDADWNAAVHRVVIDGADPIVAMQEAEKKFRERQ